MDISNACLTPLYEQGGKSGCSHRQGTGHGYTQTRSATLTTVKGRTATAVFVLATACLSAAQAPAPEAKSQVDAAPEQTATQATTPPLGVPTFYAHARQVIVEADVWKPVDKKHPDADWIPQGSLDGLPDGGTSVRRTLASMPPPARGLIAGDFHVFDNGVEQRLNYFKESDFPATGATGLWILHPMALGIWGVFVPGGPGIGDLPSATYLIGYAPPAPQPGECRTIQITVPNHYVQTNRNRYCTADNSSGATTSETKLEARMQSFATSAAKGSIQVSTKAFAFWSSGVLSLTTPVQSNEVAPPLPATDFTYVVEVHDSKAPATVHIATEFSLPYPFWNYPCPRHRSSIYVLGMLYRATGELAETFDDTYTCDVFTTPMTKPLAKVPGEKTLVPSRFDTQIELRPGDYELRFVVSDGKNFGRAQVLLRVQPLQADALAISDLAISSFLRDSSWVLRDAAAVSPAPVVPTPLVSKKVQFFPAIDASVPHRNPLSLYFEIYEPLLEANKVDVSYSLKITDLKTGSLVMNTGAMSAADWVIPGNPVIPIGLKLAIGKLPKGSYRLEIQASDSAGRQTERRQADFKIE